MTRLETLRSLQTRIREATGPGNIDLTPWIGKINPSRFWKRVKIGSPDECWEWQGSVSLGTLPYGRFYLSKTKLCRAHRFAYSLVKGGIPNGMMVCHACDNPRCCNPDHLWLGTGKDNSVDCVAKNRGSGSSESTRHARRFKKHGPSHRQAKLTSDMVREIRSSSERNIVLARKFGVCRGIISRCRKGKTYPEWSLERPTMERPFSERQITDAVASGMTLTDVCSRLGVSMTTVTRVMKRHKESALIAIEEAKEKADV